MEKEERVWVVCTFDHNFFSIVGHTGFDGSMFYDLVLGCFYDNWLMLNPNSFNKLTRQTDHMKIDGIFHFKSNKRAKLKLFKFNEKKVKISWENVCFNTRIHFTIKVFGSIYHKMTQSIRFCVIKRFKHYRLWLKFMQNFSCHKKFETASIKIGDVNAIKF